jgi:hypothetical protein
MMSRLSNLPFLEHGRNCVENDSMLLCGAITRSHNVHLKNLSFIAKSKLVFLLVFSRKPNSFRGAGGFCWPIGVTAALLGRLLRSDGHKLVKKQ